MLIKWDASFRWSFGPNPSTVKSSTVKSCHQYFLSPSSIRQGLYKDYYQSINYQSIIAVRESLACSTHHAIHPLSQSLSISPPQHPYSHGPSFCRVANVKDENNKIKGVENFILKIKSHLFLKKYIEHLEISHCPLVKIFQNPILETACRYRI